MDSEEGAGTVLTMTLVGLALVVVLVLFNLGDAVKTKHQMQNTADLAAIAGAQAFQRGGPKVACNQAKRIVEENTAAMEKCEILGSHVRVTVNGKARALPGVKVQASARAGPVNEPPG